MTKILLKSYNFNFFINNYINIDINNNLYLIHFFIYFSNFDKLQNPVLVGLVNSYSLS